MQYSLGQTVINKTAPKVSWAPFMLMMVCLPAVSAQEVEKPRELEAPPLASISKSDALAAIERMISDPLGTLTDDAKIVLWFAEQSKDVQITISNDFFEFANSPLDAFLMSHYLAGAVKFDILHPEQSKDPLADVPLALATALRAYRAIRGRSTYDNPFFDEADYGEKLGAFGEFIEDRAARSEELQLLITLRQRGTQPDEVLSLLERAQQQLARADIGGAKALYQLALAIVEGNSVVERRVVALCLRRLGDFHRTHRPAQPKEAQPFYRQALDILRTASPDSLVTASTMRYLAWSYEARQQYESAEPLRKEALAMRERRFREDNLILVDALRRLADVYEFQNMYVEAVPFRLRALELCETWLGIEDASTRLYRSHLANTYENWGRYVEAEELFLRNLGLDELAQGREVVAEISTVTRALARLYTRWGRFDQAEKMFFWTFDLYARIGSGPPTREYAYILQEYTGMLQQAGYLEEAASMRTKAAEMLSQQKEF